LWSLKGNTELLLASPASLEQEETLAMQVIRKL
jgi:hypothetical protein